MQMIGHQNVFTDVRAVCWRGLAELNERVMDGGFGENGFSIERTKREEIQRMPQMDAIKTVEAWLVHAFEARRS